MTDIRILEGFPNQHLFRLARTVLNRWVSHPLLQSLMPTDIGWFPHARYHYCDRPTGAPANILIFCVEGEGWFILDGVKRPIYTNEALFISQGTPHTYGSSDHTPWSIHWAHFIGLEAHFYVGLVPEDEHKLVVDEQCRIRVVQLFQQCYRVLMEGFVLNRMIHAAKIIQHLFGELLYNNPSFSPSLRLSRFRNIEPTLGYLRQNIDSSLALADMANHAGLSKSHFSRIFKDQTGYAPMDYFIHLKVQKAVSLLMLTDLSVREIATTVGYEDPYYFSRLFKKVTGASPSAIRNEPR